MAKAEAIGKARRLYISKADIMKHGLTAEGCRARLEAEIAKTSIPVGLARDEGRRPAESAGSPAVVPVPSISDEVQDEPMNAGEAFSSAGSPSSAANDGRSGQSAEDVSRDRVQQRSVSSRALGDRGGWLKSRRRVPRRDPAARFLVQCSRRKTCEVRVSSTRARPRQRLTWGLTPSEDPIEGHGE